MSKKDQALLIDQLKSQSAKIIGNYKRQAWAVKALDKSSNPSVEEESGGKYLAKAVLKANNGTYYPAFLTLSSKERGTVTGVYFMVEDQESFQLIPFEIAKEIMKIDESELLPFQYRTLEKVPKDEKQKNWPDFT
ncbi:hypothetical protein [Jeotgalibacillus sp. R-1-5s-1]|uniref:hypothetical protein n=1 Tax=Jeotgalibacillus sp. R-1-5s-1 TaxID=2555897 RepID=UPI00106B10A8|nr:hypothetical protein [Jeotgalibacillus sp. R-1-5s-1]TFD95746.1 hypothetical protein E2491_11225 [Jeotgalibacillus sp. R-1-5s-1]